MPFAKPLPHWEAPGIEPPLSLRQNGWKAGVKPPDEYFNYLQNKAYEALKELQENAVHKDDAGSGVTNLGFRGLLADVNGIGGPDHIDKYPEGLSAMYSDRTDWSVFLNMTDFSPTTDFLFIETDKTIQDGKINATQQITRYKKESTATPVKLISRYTRVWFSDGTYTGWSNAEKVVFQTEFATHLAENAVDAHKISNIAGLQEALANKLDKSNGLSNQQKIVRNVSLSGTQRVTLPFLAKTILINGYISNTKNISYGQYTPTAQNTMVIDTNGATSIQNGAIVFLTGVSSDVIGIVKNVTETGFDIEWTPRNGPTGTANILILSIAI